jgi:predicted TIM-barrel fold metal-dependent hydrolase
MSTQHTPDQGGAAAGVPEVIISADSHIMEPPDLWAQRLPASLRERIPAETNSGGGPKPGGTDPKERTREMAADGVSGEVLYPTLGLRFFQARDLEVQRACIQITNDYLAEYCAVAPARLWGIGSIPCDDIKLAIAEMERCKAMGMPGVLIWQVPPPELSFTSEHYEEFWAAAQDLGMPVNLHILTAFSDGTRPAAPTILDGYRRSTIAKLNNIMNSLFDLVFSGVLERYPRLKLVLAENEIGWIPFIVHEWDFYVTRNKGRAGSLRSQLALEELPSFYVNRQVYSTFINDPPGAHLLSFWGRDLCMWSSDYPHGASTWPNSRGVIERDLGALDPEIRANVLRDNVARLYGLTVPEPIGP